MVTKIIGNKPNMKKQTKKTKQKISKTKIVVFPNSASEDPKYCHKKTLSNESKTKNY